MCTGLWRPSRWISRFTRTRTGFGWLGPTRTELELPCSRCLELFRMPFDGAIDVRYLPASELSAEDEREVAEEDLDTSYYRDDQIDLNELLREQFYLALPMKPLCREECAGLCSQCGTNLNTGTCQCTSQMGRPAARAAEGIEVGLWTLVSGLGKDQPDRTTTRPNQRRETRDAESKTQTFQDPHRQAAHP